MSSEFCLLFQKFFLYPTGYTNGFLKRGHKCSSMLDGLGRHLENDHLLVQRWGKDSDCVGQGSVPTPLWLLIGAPYCFTSPWSLPLPAQPRLPSRSSLSLLSRGQQCFPGKQRGPMEGEGGWVGSKNISPFST